MILIKLKVSYTAYNKGVKYVDSLGGTFINIYLPLNTQKFPLNWVLSNTAVSRRDTTISSIVKPNVTDTTDSYGKNLKEGH